MAPTSTPSGMFFQRVLLLMMKFEFIVIINFCFVYLQVAPTLTWKRKLSDGSDATDIKEVKLSPVAHRPPERQEKRVVLGAGGLSRLKVHGNFETQLLEIEEDVEYEG